MKIARPIALVALACVVAGCATNPASNAKQQSQSSTTTTQGSTQSLITGAKSDCGQFSKGTLPTLEHLVYASKGTHITGTVPLLFYYWVKVTPANGPNSIIINQSIQGPGRRLFIGNGNGVFSLEAGTCTGFSNTEVQDPRSGSVTITFTAGSKAPSSVYIEVNYTTERLTGMTVPSAGQKVVYSYSVKSVTGTSSAVDLIPN